MTSDETKQNENPEGELISPGTIDKNDQGELFPLENFLEIEHQRIESFNRRTELGYKAIEAQDAADKRQFDYSVKKLDTHEHQLTRQHSLACRVFYFGGGFIALLVVLILGMLFWGSPEQSSAAQAILRVLGQAIGGGGFLYLAIQAIRWLISRDPAP